MFEFVRRDVTKTSVSNRAASTARSTASGETPQMALTIRPNFFPILIQMND